MYLKVSNEGWTETIFKSISHVEIYKYQKKAIALWGKDNVVVTNK